MAKNLKFSVLLDLYGGMISGKQYEAMDLYYNEDLSLAEIGDILGISRQAVRGSIKKGEENILFYEEKLGLYRKNEKLKKKLTETAAKLRRLNKEFKSEKLTECINELTETEMR